MKKKIKYLLILGIAAFLIVLTGCETKPINMALDGFFDIT